MYVEGVCSLLLMCIQCLSAALRTLGRLVRLYQNGGARMFCERFLSLSLLKLSLDLHIALQAARQAKWS